VKHLHRPGRWNKRFTLFLVAIITDFKAHRGVVKACGSLNYLCLRLGPMKFCVMKQITLAREKVIADEAVQVVIVMNAVTKGEKCAAVSCRIEL
jgi:hypothetical protein